MKCFWFLFTAAFTLVAAEPGPLPQTALWNFPSAIVDSQYRELREFYERQIQEAAPRRDAFAHNSPESQRKLLRELTGAIDQPMAPVATRVPLGVTVDYAATLVSWPLLRLGTMPPTR